MKITKKNKAEAKKKEIWFFSSAGISCVVKSVLGLTKEI